MIHTIKNIKWVIATSLVCLLLGVLTFFTFINQSFIELNNFNLQILLVVDSYKVGKTLKTGKPVGKWRFFPSQ